MKYQKINIPVQQLANGEILKIQAHTFTGSESGPTIYLQGNLHGPEVFGTALLLELIQVIKKKIIKGKMIIVPCANPMGVNQISYNSMTGRWNPQSGNNWNRIFPTTSLKNHNEEALFYQKMQLDKNLSIESKLASILRSLSTEADYVLDIHTTGSFNSEHLFTYSWMNDSFSSLNVPTHLVLDTKNIVGAFDESHVLPFLKSIPQEKITKIATWEAYHHGHIDSLVLKQRLSQIMNWLDAVWSGKAMYSSKPKIFFKSAHLHAPIAGYYSWIKKVGDHVKIDDIYAIVYQPLKGKILPIKAKFAFTLLGIYGITATAYGEQIGWIAY